MQRDTRIPVPPPQNNYADAVQCAIERLQIQSDSQLRQLGANPKGNVWELPVLNDAFEIDTKLGRVSTLSGDEVGLPWKILSLHYMGICGEVKKSAPSLGFADISAGRSYAGVYKARVISHLCATSGRSAESLRIAAEKIGGTIVAGGDLGYEFNIFPKFSLRLLWYAPDEEFPPSATVLLPENVLSFFSVEDTVVLSESLIARLSGKNF